MTGETLYYICKHNRAIILCLNDYGLEQLRRAAVAKKDNTLEHYIITREYRREYGEVL